MNLILGLGGLAMLAAVGLQVAFDGRRARAASPRPRWPAWASEPPVGTAVAEARSLELMRSVVNPDEWAMYEELGFLCVTGRRLRADGTDGLPRYRYLIYPHLPLVALLPRSMAPVREYCIEFTDTSASGDGILPTGDDILAKWMTVRADEDRLHANANICNAGCQVPLNRIERDIRRFARWSAAHAEPAPAGPVMSARY